MDGKREKGRGAVENSVKYPQLDATHWHTVSMQILFTLSPSPLPPFLAPSLPLSVCLLLLLSFSFTLSRESGATHVCISSLQRAHTPPPWLRNPAVDLHYPSFRVDSITFVYTPSTLPKQTLYERSLMIRRDAGCCQRPMCKSAQFLLTSCRYPPLSRRGRKRFLVSTEGAEGRGGEGKEKFIVDDCFVFVDVSLCFYFVSLALCRIIIFKGMKFVKNYATRLYSS